MYPTLCQQDGDSLPLSLSLPGDPAGLLAPLLPQQRAGSAPLLPAAVGAASSAGTEGAGGGTGGADARGPGETAVVAVTCSLSIETFTFFMLCRSAGGNDLTQVIRQFVFPNLIRPLSLCLFP